jgi:hypothetical protein
MVVGRMIRVSVETLYRGSALKIILLSVLLSCSARSQTDSILTSDLPIVLIDTFGQEIPDDPKITAFMGIIDRGPGMRNAITDTANIYRGYIGIEVRGFSSQRFPKLQYGIELRDSTGADVSVGLLGMSSDADWVLSAGYNDKTMMRNALAYALARRSGRYASQGRFCEVVLNGQYWGVYTLFEKLKRDKNRINVTKMATTDISGDKVTGGYIVQIDRVTMDSTEYWRSPYLPWTTEVESVAYQYVFPKAVDLAPQQRAYIQSFIGNFERTMAESTWADPVNGYQKYLDVSTAVDFFLVNELARNIDAYRLSSFLYKDRDSKGGKLKVGPVWDFDFGFGNVRSSDGAEIEGWDLLVMPGILATSVGENHIPQWWLRLGEDSTFWQAAGNRWGELRKSVFATNAVLGWIDSSAQALNEAQERNFVRWPILDSVIWENPYVGGTYANEIGYMKQWTAARLAWMDSALPPPFVPPDDSLEYALDSLAGRVADSVVTVSWRTTRERHTVQFELLRRFADSGAADPTWHTVDTLAAADSSAVPLHYVARDTVQGPVNATYRVRIVGMNEHQAYTDSLRLFIADSRYPLDVVLDSLTAGVDDSVVTIAWTTTRERHSVRFDVEWRSADSLAADTLWHLADTLKAADSSDATLRYAVADTVVGPKSLFYRVRTVGLMGHVALSGSVRTFVPDRRKTLIVAFGPFSAAATDSIVALAWTTTREQNTQQFVVQRRRTDSLATDTLWHAIRTMGGADTSTTTRSYATKDTVHFSSSMQYRVAAEGFFGQRLYSPSRSVRVYSTADTLRTAFRSFLGGYGSGSVDLTWSVAGQTNVLGHVVERKRVTPAPADSVWRGLDTLDATGTARDTVLYDFADSIRTSGKFLYRIHVLGPWGQSLFSNNLTVDITSAELAEAGVPSTCQLYQNYPNPFNPSTTIRFDLPAEVHVSIAVYSTLGQRVAVLVDGRMAAGRHEARFDASSLPTGVYFCSMRAGDVVMHRKLLLLK